MIITTVPASAFVSANPSVIGPGGAAVALNMLFLTTNNRVPIGQVLSFPSAATVGAYFGLSSNEYSQASVYFQGFTGSNVRPGAMLFAQYNTIAVPAYLRGGNVSSLTATQIEALSGILKISVNGVVETSSSINLSTSSTPSLAAAAIQAGFSSFAGTVTYDSVSGGFIFSTTATGGSETISYVTSTTGTSTTSTTTGTVLTVAGTITGYFNVGDYVAGTDSTNTLPSACTILAQLTGTPGGAGTYQISAAATPGNLTSTIVDSFGSTGTFASTLGLTSATGAVLSQGAAIATPAAFMTALTAVTTNWATLVTGFNPDVTGNANKLLFAQWINTQNYQYVYLPWDTDITPTQSNNAASSLGQLLIAGQYSGTAPIYEPADYQLAAMTAGFIASIDFTQTNGNTDLSYKSQAGITPSVTNQAVLANLEANGYNFYVTASKGTSVWDFLYPGTIAGPFKSLRRYINQIWLNNSFVYALMSLQTTVKALPYVQPGYALIEASMMNVINQATNFGAIQSGVILSASEIAEVNYAAGSNIAPTLQSAGWYLQVKDPGAVARAAGSSPIINFWYTDGGSVLQLNFSAIDVF
jgi:hypothetical protein